MRVTDFPLIALMVLAPVGLGLSPLLLPSRVKLIWRWLLALALLLLSVWLVERARNSPHGHEMIILLPFWLAWGGTLLGLLLRGTDPQTRAR